ncbi:MAG: hypothetical protein DI623_16055 [Sphingomonas sanxanigenens]|uniref:Uncharacterized protein n=1 Tax=Sphingomonas sanxanigenens TaxID=397260 RepID=A0A2W5BU99_9SPHN|nr:MAG: hypothetical protein DI623_16055 [Sphingomonas sanxanigenens]
MLILIALLAQAAPAAAALTPAQRHALERDIACPASLPGDEARIASMKRFINRYALYAPRSTINERLAFRDRVLARRRCRQTGSELIHTFPES